MTRHPRLHHRRSTGPATVTRAPLSLARDALLTGDGPATLITVGGEIDMSTTAALVEFIARDAREQPTEVLLDLSSVSFFGADGIRALEEADRLVTGAGGRLSVRAMSTAVRFVLSVTGSHDRFIRNAAREPTPPTGAAGRHPAGGPRSRDAWLAGRDGGHRRSRGGR
ncbi:STAS domain-containing protein [Micromonospora siamensis]|uniref:Anti-anti-sigma factor n=1 Tax=Micromonospora siamensis TaxID=299152 RepID=A0A1C5H7D3_9ACTN|nr:STAS domain-containing protein [Micromonospora siamensis]SCG41935.1 anti-anti-sigma factor [Micromonospora siamensis]